MFEFKSGKKDEAKCYVTHGLMGHLDPKQLPVKRKPFSSILAVPFINKVELVLPDELYEMIKEELSATITVPSYSRVVLPLRALVDGDFFNEYIKKGNISMLSEGISKEGNSFFLKDGLLSLILERESYERAGLAGQPYGPKATGGIRPKWIVEINLRLPSMLHGKKGFDRIVYAFKNVLTDPVTWLFADLGSQELLSDPIKQHSPVMIQCSQRISRGPKVPIPSFQPPLTSEPGDKESFTDFSVSLYEWLSLISLQSPRLEIEDNIDPFLSRYAAPKANQPDSQTEQLVMITWEGFVSASWVHNAFMKVLLAASAKTWFSFAACGLGNGPAGGCQDLVVLKLPGTSNEYVLWEVF